MARTSVRVQNQIGTINRQPRVAMLLGQPADINSAFTLLGHYLSYCIGVEAGRSPESRAAPRGSPLLPLRKVYLERRMDRADEQRAAPRKSRCCGRAVDYWGSCGRLADRHRDYLGFFLKRPPLLPLGFKCHTEKIAIAPDQPTLADGEKIIEGQLKVQG
jgi:hypothetical protein